MRKLADILNFIFCPLAFSLFSMILFLYFNNIIAFEFLPITKIYILSFVSIVTLIIPISCHFIMLRFKNTFNNKEAILVFLYSIVCFGLSRTFNSIEISNIICGFFFYNSFFILIAAIISLFTSLNFYAYMVGELIALYIWTMHNYIHNNMVVLFSLFFLFGIVGWAQISSNKSKLINYLLGTLTGVLVVFVIFGYTY